MSIDQLKYIIAVSEYQSFSVAAEKLFVSQSAISQSIIRLERQLEIQIFDRSTTDIQVTPSGRDLITQAKKVIQELERFEELCLAVKSMQNNDVRIGILKDFYSASIMKLFSSSYLMNSQIKYVEEDSVSLAKMIAKNELDIAIFIIYPESLYYLNSDTYIQSFPLSFHMYCTMHSDYEQFSSVSPEQLADEKIIIYDDSFIKWYVQQLQIDGEALPIELQSNNKSLVDSLIKNEGFIGIDIDSNLRQLEENPPSELLKLPLQVDALPTFHIGVAYSTKIQKKKFQQLAEKINATLTAEQSL